MELDHGARPIVSAKTSFVGRQPALGLLKRHLTEAATGQTRVVMLSGEPGIGKTRLLHQVAEEARQREQQEAPRVLSGGASQAEGMPPYLPFLEAMGQHNRSIQPEVLRAQLGEHASTLATICPELHGRLGELPVGYPLPPEQARLRLFEAVADVLAAIAHRSSLILVLDDLHWADPASLDLLCHLPRHQPSARLLIVGAYRDAEAEQNAALQRAISELRRQRVLTTVVLGPLSADETADLASGHVGWSVPNQVSLVLHAHSDGNPFFAEEILAYWMESGALERVWEEGAAFAPSGALPRSLVQAIQQRLMRLSTDLVNHLRVAAIIGRSFDLSLLAEVTNQDVETAEEGLLGAVRAGLILGDGPGTFSFRHDTVRECLYVEVSSARRERLHLEIGEALEKRNAPASSQHLAELVFHFTRSGNRAAGVTYSLQAAENALLSHAAEEAVAHFRTALDLLDADDTRRGAIALELGDAALQIGHEDEAVAAYGDAHRRLVQSDDPVGAARASHGLGMAKWRRGLLAEAQIALEAAITLLGDRGGSETVRVLVDLAGLLNVHTGQQSDGLAVARRALDLAHPLGDRHLEAAATRTVGQLTAWGNDIPGGIALLERALVLATAADDPAEAAEICGTLANLYFASLEVQRSYQITLMRMEFARQCHQPYELRHVHAWLAELALQRGEWAQTEQLVIQGQVIVDRPCERRAACRAASGSWADGIVSWSV